MTRSLEIQSIRAIESGKYFCVQDRKQTQNVKNEEIVTRIEKKFYYTILWIVFFEKLLYYIFARRTSKLNMFRILFLHQVF